MDTQNDYPYEVGSAAKALLDASRLFLQEPEVETDMEALVANFMAMKEDPNVENQFAAPPGEEGGWYIQKLGKDLHIEGNGAMGDEEEDLIPGRVQSHLNRSENGGYVVRGRSASGGPWTVVTVNGLRGAELREVVDKYTEAFLDVPAVMEEALVELGYEFDHRTVARLMAHAIAAPELVPDITWVPAETLDGPDAVAVRTISATEKGWMFSIHTPEVSMDLSLNWSGRRGELRWELMELIQARQNGQDTASSIQAAEFRDFLLEQTEDQD